MMRALFLTGLMVGALPALAAGPASDAANEDEPAYSSAALAGTLKTLPPSPAGFPMPILLKMRERLGGEPVESPPADTSDSNDH